MKISLLRRLIQNGWKLKRVPTSVIGTTKCWEVLKYGDFVFHLWDDDLIQDEKWYGGVH